MRPGMDVSFLLDSRDMPEGMVGIRTIIPATVKVDLCIFCHILRQLDHVLDPAARARATEGFVGVHGGCCGATRTFSMRS